MASGGRKKKDEDGAPGLGTALAIGAAAAGVAALLYGAKKLFDFVNEEQPKSMPETNDPSYRPPQPSSSMSRQPLPPEARVCQPQAPKPHVVHSLADQLNSYLRDYVEIPSETMSRAMHFTEIIQKKLQTSITESNHDISCRRFEEVQAISPHMKILVILNLESSLWHLKSISELETFYTICRQNMDENSNFNSFASDGCISKNLVLEYIANLFREQIDLVTSEYNIKVTNLRSSIMLDVNLDINQSFQITLTPAVTIDHVTLLAETVPWQSDASLWQETSHHIFEDQLAKMDPDRCCHLQSLRIMKSIALNHPESFGRLEFELYRTMLVQMMIDTPEEDLWLPQCLQEKYVDFLNELMFCLQAYRLPHISAPQLNLLSNVDPKVCDSLVDFIVNRIGKEKLSTLLIRIYKPRSLNMAA